MIRPALISLALATGASASPLDREAHVYTPDITLGEAMDLGIVPEPVMEVTGPCPSAWHYRQDWHEFCGRAVEIAVTEVEWPKAPTPEEIINGPRSALAAPAFAYFGTPRASSSGARSSASLAWLGGGWNSGGSRHSRVREGDVVTIFEKHIHFDGCDCGCCDEPAPVPLPASWLMMLAGLCGLGWMRRRT